MKKKQIKKTKRKIKRDLIAPCGMNCALCLGYLREKNTCPGCRKINSSCAKTCRQCRILRCKKRQGKYCFQCEIYPCARLKHLDERYRSKYEMSMINNLEYIKKHSIRKFVQRENKRWAKGDKVYCVHHHKYYKI